ncbi:nucleoside monophosphate kinase, partial [Patescibacteria group bacterium]|nr:nucleoside monophosphate kinase [Patescibacteria group bacterium]
MLKYKNIILFGPQGSGKGTQADILAEKFGMPHISTGEIFRQEIKEHTEIGKMAEQII